MEKRKEMSNIPRSVKNLGFLLAVLLFTAGGVYAVNAALTFSSTSVTSDGDLQIVFEGATANDFETTLTATDPTADRTVTLPDAGGAVVLDTATQTLTNKTLTAPKLLGFLADANNNELFVLTATGSAINELTIANATAGNSPTIIASGGDTNVGIGITTKGVGNLQLTLGSANGMTNVLTGNLKVGDGTPGVSLDGEDAYIEGTLEVDGATRFDGTVSLPTAGAVIALPGDVGTQSPAPGVGPIDVNMVARTVKIPIQFTGVDNDFNFSSGAMRNYGKKIFDFPVGNIIVLNSAIDIISTSSGELTSSYMVGLGSSGTEGTDSTLSASNLSDIFSGGMSVSQGTTTKFSSGSGGSSGAMLSNEDADMYFNIGIGSGSMSGNGTIAITGTVYVTYIVVP